jgi:hypothetical protein
VIPLNQVRQQEEKERFMTVSYNLYLTALLQI